MLNVFSRNFSKPIGLLGQRVAMLFFSSSMANGLVITGSSLYFLRSGLGLYSLNLGTSAIHK